MNPLRCIVLIGTLALMVGCVSKPVEEEYSPPPLMIAQNSDGKVSLAWESEPGYYYTIYYQAAAGEDWIALDSAMRVRGTGQTLNANDRVNPNKPPRRYRILQEEAKE